MRTHLYQWLLLPVLMLCLAGLPAPAQRPKFKDKKPAAPGEIKRPATADADAERAADIKAIEQSSRDFSAAYDKADAKAVAAMWTENGEYHSDDGISLRGRKAIEDAFREHFNEKRAGRAHVVIEAIRFPARDLAIEDGLLRQESTGKDLPSSTRYSVLHVREGGQWKIAVSREWGADQDRLADLEWLIGKWSVAVKDQEVILSFERDASKAFLVGQFAKKEKDKTSVSGTMKIGLDPRSGQLRSWHFDNDGGHGQARWIRDGSRWVLDARGVTGAGAETASVNLLGRLGPDEFTWQSIDRMIDQVGIPNTVPLKLRRVNDK